ncbi:hypothetical protein L2E82_52133 [Cichorium intybus]|nr:hypothetical protein L2E82_52133 [Cichorium intybus]
MPLLRISLIRKKRASISRATSYTTRRAATISPKEPVSSDPGKETVIAAENKHAVPGDWNPLRSAEQADNRQKMLSKAAGLKREADP